MSFRVDVFEGAKIAAKSLSLNRLRSLLTTFGVLIGVATLLAILGIIQGLNASFAKQLSNLGSNTLYVSKFKWTGNFDDFMAAMKRKNFTLEHVEAIRRGSKYVSSVAPMTGTRGEVAFLSDSMGAVQFTGTEAEYLELSGYRLTRGRFIGEMDDLERKPVVVLGSAVVDELFPTMNPLGHRVTLNGRSFEVIGTLAHKGKLLDSDFDRAVIIPYRVLLGTFGRQWPTQIAVQIDAPEHMKIAEDDLIDILRRTRQTPPGADNDFAINRPEQLMQLYDKLTGALYAVLAGIGMITLLVGGIGIMNIMLVSVRERTREIGVRRALGARKRTIVMQFLMEAATVSAAGGAAGTALGLGLAKIVSLISPLAASVQPITILFGVGFAAFIGLVAGIWPAARAANLDPVEALRYE